MTALHTGVQNSLVRPASAGRVQPSPPGPPDPAAEPSRSWPRTSWRDRAACRDQDPERFFPKLGEQIKAAEPGPFAPHVRSATSAWTWLSTRPAGSTRITGSSRAPCRPSAATLVATPSCAERSVGAPRLAAQAHQLGWRGRAGAGHPAARHPPRRHHRRPLPATNYPPAAGGLAAQRFPTDRAKPSGTYALAEQLEWCDRYGWFQRGLPRSVGQRGRACNATDGADALLVEYTALLCRAPALPAVFEEVPHRLAAAASCCPSPTVQLLRSLPPDSSTASNRPVSSRHGQITTLACAVSPPSPRAERAAVLFVLLGGARPAGRRAERR